MLMAAASVPDRAGAVVTQPADVQVSYGRNPLQTIDVFPALNPGSHSVVMVHGGGWESGINANMQLETANGLQRAGFAVFDVNYRSDSSTQPAFPYEIDDVVSATRYAMAKAAAYNADPSEVTILGGSSGGQLAGMAALELNSSKSGTVRSVVTLSGPSDLPLLIQYWAATAGPVGDLHTSHIMTALGCDTPATCPVSVEDRWSPDTQVGAANCPSNWLVLNGDAELMPVEQADAMTHALRNAGCNVTETIIPTTAHSFHYWTIAKPEIEAFISAD